MSRIHPAWPVAIVTAAALLAAAAFRSTTGVLMEPIMATTGWSMATVSGAASLNLVLYGIATPFAAAAMQVWGVRRTVVTSLAVVSLSAAATAIMTAPWQLWVLWGLCIGIATGALALTFGTIVANRWFVAHRNFVTGIFSAATAAGQVIFVPLIATVANGVGWKVAALVTAGCAATTAVACAFFLRERPADVGARPYGADHPEADLDEFAPVDTPEPPLTAAFRVLREGVRRWPFWVLLATFFVCGWSTNGLIVTHFVPAAHDHSMPPTMAAGMIGVIGIFDVLGTIASGWLTDRFDSRVLLAVYYVTRGLSLVFVNNLLGPNLDVPMWAWVIFYGLDWTATVPPTVALCREVFGIADSGVAFGWVYASHMIGAGLGANVSGMLRSEQGTYAAAWIVSAVLCVVAGVLAVTIRQRHIEAGPQVVSW